MTRTILSTLLLGSLLALGVGCSDDSSGGRDGGGSSFDGFGGDGQTGGDGGGLGDAFGSGDGVSSCGKLVAIIRDFKAWDSGAGHPDFERSLGDEPRYVFGDGTPKWSHSESAYLDTTLDAEGKPKYLLGSSNSPSETIHGEAGFAQWYRDVSGVNQRVEVPIIDQDPSPDRFVFDSSTLPGGQFFPIDGQGFGDEGRDHNFHFTTELRGTFRYNGGEKFTFSGDDDVFVFVNNKLALDLGGVHGKQEATIDFDAIAGWLGITAGNSYAIALFHAERHTTESNFRFETSIRCLAIK